MDIGDWLRSLGLEQYEAAFRDNAITGKVLPNLTADDLKDLGVGMVGHRRTLLDAIAYLRVHANAKASPSEAPSPLSTPAQETAERRQVTVMFSDLVGSTALSARMDPEDLREIISAYQKCVAETVRRFGGFVAKYMGDGVLVYFGYPQAHEDDTERAVRAGLELVEAVGGLKSSAPLRTRVGIATGLVVVGDLIGSGAAQEQAVVGETPNLAARLQAIAEPNTVVIAESTRKLLGNLFDLQDLSAQDLKGIGSPVRAWAVLRPASVESRFEAMHVSGLTELVGREEELELLLRRWSKVKAGEGQVVLLSGEAGIGKSRLTAALMERLESEPHTRLRYFCSPQHTDSALYPLIGQMERAAGLAHGDTAQAKFDKLDALLAQTSTSAQDVALFADMLSLPNDERYPTLDMTPEQRRQKTLEALGSQMEALSRSNPVLMIFEDAHWADHTSLEVFSRVVDRLRYIRVLLIVTYRPEFDPPWTTRLYVTALTLDRLAQRDIEAMIDGVIGNKLIPASVRQDIIERTDGIPLFVEEMTKSVLEVGTQSPVERTAPANALPVVPATLQASLMARLDRLGGPAKEVAQIGAALGREFSYALLAAATRKSKTELQATLNRLVQSGLLFQNSVSPQSTYLFKHALVQDAAYSTLLRGPRRALHARITKILESGFADIAENRPEILAHHSTEAGQIARAAELWGKAAQRSLGRSAFVEAVAQVTRALAQISTLPPTPALRRQQIEFQIALAYALMGTKGIAAPETIEALGQARLLIERAEASNEPADNPQLLLVLNGFWLMNHVAFNGDALRELAARFLVLAKKQGAMVPLIRGHRLMGVSLMWTGNIAEGRTHFDRAVELCDHSDRPLGTRAGNDLWVYTLSDLAAFTLADRAMALWTLGYPDAALADVRRVVTESRDLARVASLAYAVATTSRVCILCGNFTAANVQLDEAITSADEKGAMFWRALVGLSKGCVFALTGKPSDAVQMLASGIAAWRSTRSTAALPIYLSDLAMAHAGNEQFDDAWRCIDEAMTMIKTTKQVIFEAEVNRIAGETALRSFTPDLEKAEIFFERAIAIARQQQSKSWELRAAMSMARLWRDQDKRDEAHDLLAPVYGWFTEGFDTLDLKEAKNLLDELSS